jgi:hypothetical protein
MATYKGSQCKNNCEGHMAGESYVQNGGRLLTKTSSSFNNGMRIAQRELKAQGINTRMRKPK